MTNKRNKGQGGKVVHLQAPEADSPPDVYVNQVNIAFSVYDVTFSFGRMPLPEAGHRPGQGADLGPPEEAAIIRMSPQHAKIFHKLLGNHIKQYEEQIGEIPLPSQLIKDLGLNG